MQKKRVKMTRLKRVYGYECIGQVVFLTKCVQSKFNELANFFVFEAELACQYLFH